jgi:hypothetical protein
VESQDRADATHPVHPVRRIVRTCSISVAMSTAIDDALHKVWHRLQENIAVAASHSTVTGEPIALRAVAALERSPLRVNELVDLSSLQSQERGLQSDRRSK